MTKQILAALASAVVLLAVGCDSSSEVAVDPPPPETSSEAESETMSDATIEPVEAESPVEVPVEARGLDEEEEPIPEGLSPTADPALLKALPSIEALPALSTETAIDEKTKLPFAKLGDFPIRDGVYVFRIVSTDGMRELIMTVETQTNGFVVRRGDRTRLRFVVDGDKATFASEPGSGEIAGRGAAAGDDWVKGSFRVKNEDGTTSEGTFELRKLQDPKTPRADKTAPAPAAEKPTPAGPVEPPATGETESKPEEGAPTAAAREG